MQHILLIGNPNVGKSTLIGALGGQNAKTANISGVTAGSSEHKVSFQGQDREMQMVRRRMLVFSRGGPQASGSIGLCPLHHFIGNHSCSIHAVNCRCKQC